MNIYLVESGLIRLFFCDSHGREYLLNLVGPGEVVGMPLFREHQTRIGGAAAVQTSVVLTLSIEDMRAFMRRSPQFIHNIYHETDAGLRKLFIYARGLAMMSLSQRMAAMLLALCDASFNRGGSGDLELPLSQTELASWIGASRGRFNRTLNHLQQLGLIRISGQKITILDRPALEKLAHP